MSNARFGTGRIAGVLAQAPRKDLNELFPDWEKRIEE
jgi:hypothetical protein